MISLKSKITVKILNYFLFNPKKRRYINELAILLSEDSKNVYRKLQDLEKEGILKSEFQGKQRYFYLNKVYPLLKEYKAIFFKKVGFEQKLRMVLQNVKGINEAYLYGSYAKNKMDSNSDLDLLVIGNHSLLDVQKSIAKIQKEIGREINIVNLSDEEFKKKKKNNNPFIKNIFSDKIIKLI